VCWWVRDRRFLWFFCALTIVANVLVGVLEHSDPRAWLQRSMSVAAVLVTARIFHHLIGSWRTVDEAGHQLKQRSDELARANQNLSAREHEIATQNEELRSQTEELERQSEELRVTNDELARRERTLEALLRLSRSLSAETSRSDALDHICQTLGEMVNGPGLGVAIKLFERGVLRVVCHFGFGADGPANDVLPYEQSFARLVIERNHTGYLEDINLRPDVVIPQPKTGERFRSIMAAPLRVNGKPIGTLEVLSHEPKSWSDEQIGMLESLASQTSISLQSAELFERVERERRRFETIFRTLPIGVSVMDAATRRINNNPGNALMLHVPSQIEYSQIDEVSGFRRFRGGKEIPLEQMPLFRAALQGEEVHGEEIELVFRGGKKITVLVSAAPIRTPEKIEAAVAAYVDITALKSLQQELDTRRRSAEESSVRKSRFLAQVSHDIRNPVNAISLLAELLYRTASEPALAGEVPSIAADLRRNALSLVDLVTDVLDLTRFDSGRIDLEESEFSLNELIHDECRNYHAVASEKGVNFQCEIPTAPIFIRTDRVKFSRVLGNLVSNALKFTEKGSVQITAGHEGENGDANMVWVRVTDTGPGIAPEFHERIFEEFFQLRNNDGRRGAGLGLAICKRLVEAMGGSIRVESELGRGSCFVMTLPHSVLVRR
ncbi:MAG TPA: ATP-binding protein, partial [Tepidisphaeraceae bacterium]|nr:ATP-binding protein [Tepidisphaeraceae bacterium]